MKVNTGLVRSRHEQDRHAVRLEAVLRDAAERLDVLDVGRRGGEGGEGSAERSRDRCVQDEPDEGDAHLAALGAVERIVSSRRASDGRDQPGGATIGCHDPTKLLTMSDVTVRDAVLRLLRSFGMQRIFGNPGSTELPLFLDFPADFRIRPRPAGSRWWSAWPTAMRQATNNAAFVNLHSAVGVGHAMGAIFTAWKNRTPLVITAGQQARSLFPFDPFLFSAQATELPSHTSSGAASRPGPKTFPGDRSRLLPRHAAAARTRPDLDPVRRLGPRLRTGRAAARQPRPRCDAAVLDAIGAPLDASERPAFVVGAGVDRGGAWDEVRRLAERHRARVFTAPMSARCGFAEDHPQFAGFLPAMRERIVAALAGKRPGAGARCARLHLPRRGHGPHVPTGAALCQITDDADTAARAPVGTAAWADLRDAVQTCWRAAPRDRPAPTGRPARPAPRRRCRCRWRTPCRPWRTLRDPDHVVVEEAPSARPVMHDHLPTLRQRDLLHDGQRRPRLRPAGRRRRRAGAARARVIALVGDGSAMYSIQALWSAVQLKLAMTFVILNNRRYAALQEFAPTFGFAAGAKLEGTDLAGLDFVAMARGMGVVDAVRVDRPEALRDALEAALRSAAPALVEIVVA